MPTAISRFGLTTFFFGRYTYVSRDGHSYVRLAGKLAGGDEGAAFPNADRALFRAINGGRDAANDVRR